MLQSVGSQRVGHDWVTELNWDSRDSSVTCVQSFLLLLTDNLSRNTLGSQPKGHKICFELIFLWKTIGTFDKSQKTNEATELTDGKTAASAVMGLWVVERDSLSSISLSKQPVEEMWVQVMASFFDMVVNVLPSGRISKPSPGQVFYYQPSFWLHHCLTHHPTPPP